MGICILLDEAPRGCLKGDSRSGCGGIEANGEGGGSTNAEETIRGCEVQPRRDPPANVLGMTSVSKDGMMFDGG